MEFRISEQNRDTCAGRAFSLYPTSVEFLHERALIFGKSEHWTGWFCQRCSWSKPVPKSNEDRDVLAREIQKLFDAHSCDEFGPKIWRTNA